MSENFWGNPTLEPKRAYRWLLSIPGLEDATWIVKKINKPSFSVTETEHNFINHKFYYPGRVEWNTVSMTLVDPVSPDATEKLMAILTAMGYNFPSTYAEATKTTITKEEATAALTSVKIRQIGGGSGGSGAAEDVIEEWTLQRCWFKSVTFGDLDYESDEIINIEVEMRYDWATHSKTAT
jgi:hypothetical protein